MTDASVASKAVFSPAVSFSASSFADAMLACSGVEELEERWFVFGWGGWRGEQES